MFYSRIAAILVPLFGLVAIIGVPNIGMAEEEYKSTAKSRTLVEEPLPGDKSKTVVIKEFSMPPGWTGGRHYHPGPVYVYVLEGQLTIETEGRGVQTFKAGELYEEPVRSTMQARNVSASDDLRLIVFQIGETGKPMMIKAE